MSRSLLILCAASLVSFAVGCGDASEPAFRKESSVGMPSGSGGDQNSNPTPAPPASDPSSNPAATPDPGPAPTGNVYFRVANFFSTAADACVSSDGGATWFGPIMKTLAGKSLDPATVSARVTVKNGHFTVRAVYGTCSVGIGTDVKADIAGEWPATIVLGQKSGSPEIKVLTDEPSVSASATFIRLVHTTN